MSTGPALALMLALLPLQAALAGCGQKGPLSMPKAQGAASSASAPMPVAPAR